MSRTVTVGVGVGRLDSHYRRRGIDDDGGAVHQGVAGGRWRIRFAVGSRDAEIIFAVGEDVGIKGEGRVVEARFQGLPGGFVVAAEVQVMQARAVVIGVVGGPGRR